MINLSEFNDLVSRNGRGDKNNTYVRIGDNECKLTLGETSAKEVKQYLGTQLNVKVSRDLGILVLMRGNDRRLSTNRDISLVSLRQAFRDKFGGAIKLVYFDAAWDEDEHGTKVYVLRWTGKKEYAADMTVHKVRG